MLKIERVSEEASFKELKKNGIHCFQRVQVITSFLRTSGLALFGKRLKRRANFLF